MVSKPVSTFCRKQPAHLSLLHTISLVNLQEVCAINSLHKNSANMETQQKETITVQNTVDAPIEKVWEYWTKPEHITQWNNAS